MTQNRMRYAQQAYDEILKMDPNTCITITMIRRIVALGAVPSIRVGRRRLFNLDDLITYLSQNSIKHE